MTETLAPLPQGAHGEDAALEQRLVTKARGSWRRQRAVHVLGPLITTMLIAVAWQVAVTQLEVPRYILPKPTEIFAALINQSDVLLEHSIPTISAIVVGFVLSVVFGVLIGLALFTWPLAERSIYPLIVAAQAVPKVAIAPLFAIWFGYGLATRSLIAFLIAVFPVLVSMTVGLKSLEEEKVWLARSMGLSSRATFFKIRLPQAFPTLFGGIKVALALSAVGAIVGEFIGGASGLGYLIQRANHDFNTPLLFASLALIASYTVLLFIVLEAVERVAIPWRSPRDRSSQER